VAKWGKSLAKHSEVLDCVPMSMAYWGRIWASLVKGVTIWGPTWLCGHECGCIWSNEG
jgi:hypothetical protein